MSTKLREGYAGVASRALHDSATLLQSAAHFTLPSSPTQYCCHISCMYVSSLLCDISSSEHISLQLQVVVTQGIPHVHAYQLNPKILECIVTSSPCILTSRIKLTAARSFTLPVGFMNSHLP